MFSQAADLFARSKISTRYLSCMFLVCLADFLFYDHHAGWTLGLFGSGLLALSIAHNRKRVFASRLSLGFVTSSVVLIVALVEAPDFYVFLLLCLTLSAFAFSIRRPDVLDFRRILKGSLGILVLREARAFLRLASYKCKRKTERRQRSFIKHWLMPVVLVSVFGILFIDANPVFSLWFSAININWLYEIFSPFRFMFWAVVAVFSWAILRPKLKVKVVPLKVTVSLAPTDFLSVMFNERSVRIALILFNVLFAVQNCTDVAVLWTGAALPKGISYAAYAHQGAYPLMFTAMLAALFVLIALRPHANTSHMPFVRALIYVWVGQNVFLVVSSVMRLCGYIDEFSLTLLRVWALIWMCLVGSGLILIIARIYFEKSNLWLINMNGLLLYSTLCVSCFANFGGLIADYNVAHCAEVTNKGERLDRFYIYSLGVEALPALTWFYGNHPAANQREAENADLQDLRSELSVSMKDWRRWTLRAYLINRELELIPAPAKVGSPVQPLN